MPGLVMIAAGLFLTAIDFEGDFSLQWWWLSVPLIALGVLVKLAGPWFASAEDDARFSAVDMDVDAHTPARGAALLGGSATPGGFSAPRGLNPEETDR
jgi:hypothetical protein